MEELSLPDYGFEKSPNALDQLKLEQAEYERRDMRSTGKDSWSFAVSEVKDSLRPRCSSTKTTKSIDMLYAEISKSGIYIYDPHCPRCNKIMAKTRGSKKNSKRSSLTRVQKIKPSRHRAYTLKKMQSDCYLAKINRDMRQNQSLNINGENSEMNILETKKLDSSNGSGLRPGTSKSSFRSCLSSTMNLDNEPMI